MARHDRYDDRNRGRRRDNRDEGFFERVRDFFSDRDEENDRDWEYRQRYDRDYNRETRGIHHPGYSYGQQGWMSSTHDRDYGMDDEQSYNRGYDRDYGRDYGRSYGEQPDRNQDWERTRQWRRDAGYQEPGQRRGRTTFGNLYGQNYSQAGWDADDERGGEEYSEGYGRSYNRGGEYRGRHDNRDWEFQQGAGSYPSERDFYGMGHDYDAEEARYNYYDRDWPQARRDRMRSRGQYGSRRGGMGGQQYGTAGMRSDYEGSYGQQRSSGMRSDYGSRYGNEERGSYERRPHRYERGSQYDYGSQYDPSHERSYGQDYIGYEREGAFYQDLDEPVNYEYWEIWEIPGQFSGLGPQNYRRSNESITDDVCQRLTSHGRVDASKIEIQVEDGEVVLKGTVPDREMKRLAEDTAESVSGVREVRNEIRVQHQERASGESDWATRRELNRGQEQQRAGSRQRDRQTDPIPDTGTVGQSTAGAGLTSSGATSMEAMEAASGAESKRSQLREGMEVIGKEGKVVGRVKEIRQGDFLIDRDMARDVYVPFNAISSVGAQAMLNIKADAVDDQDWEKPDLI